MWYHIIMEKVNKRDKKYYQYNKNVIINFQIS